jgi:hypothetical protein
MAPLLVAFCIIKSYPVLSHRIAPDGGSVRLARDTSFCLVRHRFCSISIAIHRRDSKLKLLK